MLLRDRMLGKLGEIMSIRGQWERVLSTQFSFFIRDLVVAENLSDTKVNYLQISVLVKQKVFQFEVTVHNVAVMEVF